MKRIKLTLTSLFALLLAFVLVAPSAGIASAAPQLDHKIKQENSGKSDENLLPSKETRLKPAPKIEKGKMKELIQAGKQGLTTEGTNNSPDTATFMNLNTMISDTIAAAGEQDWYLTYAPDAGKLTAFLQTVNNASIDYDLHVFKYNETTGTLENELVSAYGPTHYEQLSTLASAGGYYFICVNSYQGSDAVNPYTLALPYATAYDSIEPDDNPWQAVAKSGGYTASQTLDNGFDEDWTKFTVSKTDHYTFSFTAPAAHNYQVQIYNSSLGLVYTLNKNNQSLLKMSPGTYYFKVATTDTVDPSAAYQLSLRYMVPPASITITDIETDGGVYGKPSYYTGGDWYRVKSVPTFIGYVTDAQGARVPNTPLTFTVDTPQTYRSTTTAYGMTDANGAFRFSMQIPYAAGVYSYDNWVSTHYYDHASFTIQSIGASYSDGLYHFAYQI